MYSFCKNKSLIMVTGLIILCQSVQCGQDNGFLSGSRRKDCDEGSGEQGMNRIRKILNVDTRIKR